MKEPYQIIKIDKYTKKIQMPNLLLMTRSFDIIGKIPYYTDWRTLLSANSIDEISFTVHKYVNGNVCPIWDDLIDLKIVNVMGVGYFEISVNYTDNTETVKSVQGISIEAELAQIPLHEFHVNDDDATATMEITDYNGKDFNDHGDFIPTVFYNPKDEAHSLLHRVLADKAPHWSIGYVTPYIALSEEDQPEDVRTFQRTYTCNGTTIYDFLTGDVAKESNVIFTFDVVKKDGKLERTINCYSLCDCIDQETGEVKANSIGEDTLVFISKNKLANEVTISSNKDNVKNCFRIEGGDDVITDMVRAVNMNGSNYIYQFADFQYNDMPKALVDAIKEYNEKLSKETDTYYGKNGIYTRLCKAYDDLAYYESEMMPDVSIKETTGEEQYKIMVKELTSMTVGVSSFNNYNNNLFVGVSNNVEAMANVLIDARYKAEIIQDTTSYYSNNDTNTHEWTGNIRITRAADETDYFPKTDEQINACFTVNIDDDELTFARQKIEKALHKGSMLDIDFDVANMNDKQIREYFNLYSLNRLKSFYDGYNSCLSILMQLDADSPVRKEMYDRYYTRMSIVSDILDTRQKQVDQINDDIKNITTKQIEFQEKWNFQNYLEKAGKDFYKIFCSYRREDTYTNNNYISDGLSTSECLEKAKELVEAATAELKKSCMLQRTVSTSLNNLFALPEFESLYEKFALFNYIRIRTEDEILKLRLIGVEFSGDSVNEINVTFSEQIESIDGRLSDLQSIIQQARNMATSFPSTALQAKKGETVRNTVLDMYANGLNAAKTMLANNDDNEVTITKSGIICRRMDDEGYYGDKQLRITGNMLAFTRNAWKNVELAIGETIFTNPITGIKSEAYGIIADNIVGNLIAGSNMYIGNENGSVTITGDGINIDKGVIKWGSDNVNAPDMDDINGFTEFKNKVNTALTGSATTEIGSDYVISPYIGGGYGYWTNGDYSVEIDPNHMTKDDRTKDGYLFCIRDKSKSTDDDVIMGVDTDGDGYFKGTVYATDGYFSGKLNVHEGSIGSFDLSENGLSNSMLKILSNSSNNASFSLYDRTIPEDPIFKVVTSHPANSMGMNAFTVSQMNEITLSANDICLGNEKGNVHLYGEININDINLSDMFSKKVDKIPGKDLSTNDYTTAEKNKLANLVSPVIAMSSESFAVDKDGTLISKNITIPDTVKNGNAILVMGFCTTPSISNVNKSNNSILTLIVNGVGNTSVVNGITNHVSVFSYTSATAGTIPVTLRLNLETNDGNVHIPIIEPITVQFRFFKI